MLSAREILYNLVRIQSVSGNEEAIVDYITYLLRKKRSIDYDIQYLGESSYNLIVNPVTNPELSIITHVDTIPILAEPRISGDIIYGTGSVDDKASVASLLLLILRDGLADNVSAVFLAQEESTGAGSVKYLEKYRPERALVMEPTNLKLADKGHGLLSFILSCTGEYMHPDYIQKVGKESAVELLISEINRLKSALRESGISMAILNILSEDNEYVIPSWAKASIEISIPPDLDVLNVLDLVQKSASENCVITTQDIAQPFKLNDAGFRVLLKRAYSNVFGEECNFTTFEGWTDANNLADLGIPSAIFGPGSFDVIHSEKEHINVSDVEGAYRFLRKLQKLLEEKT